jgi:hypothetical protein
MKRAQRKPRDGDTRDPLFNQSVERALAILEVFGGERRPMNLAEISAAVGSKLSSVLLETARAASGGIASRLSG